MEVSIPLVEISLSLLPCQGKGTTSTVTDLGCALTGKALPEYCLSRPSRTSWRFWFNCKTQNEKKKKNEKRAPSARRVWAGLHMLTKHRLVPRHVHILSYPKRGQPYICFHSSVGYEMLEPSNCWRAAGALWECSVSLTHHPLCFFITCPHLCAARWHCRNGQSVYLRVCVLERKLHSGFVAKDVPQTCL